MKYASWLHMWLCYSKYAIEVIQMLNFTGTDSRRQKLQELKNIEKNAIIQCSANVTCDSQVRIMQEW